jgi:hypothetical protein
MPRVQRQGEQGCSPVHVNSAPNLYMTMRQNEHPKLNIFALPNQTTVLFGMMATIILGAVMAGSMDAAPLSMRPIAVLLALLPLRAFLARPEREFARYHEASGSAQAFEKLQAEVTFLARMDVGLSRAPVLKVFDEAVPLQAIGTFRRWYVMIGLDEAIRLQDDVGSQGAQAAQTRARLIHELYHFKTGDYWQLGYAGELLRLTALVMAWAFAFALGYGLLLVMAKPDILQFDLAAALEQARATAPPPIHEFVDHAIPALLTRFLPTVEEARHRAAQVSIPLAVNFALGSTYPFALMGLVLWGVYWRKLWRIREFYADAGSVRTQGASGPLAAILRGASAARRAPQGWRRLFQRVRRFHAFADERLAALAEPARVFDSWKGAALLAGSLALILEMLLVTPLTLAYVHHVPMHVPTLAVFVVVCFNFLIPTLAQGRTVTADLLKIVAVVTAARLALLAAALVFMTAVMFVDPEFFAQSMTMARYVIARFAGIPQAIEAVDSAALVTTMAARNLAQVVAIGGIWLAALMLTGWMLQRVWTWYHTPSAGYVAMVSRRVVWGMGVFLGLTVIPLATAGLLAPDNLAHPLNMLAIAAGLLIAAAGLGWFWRADRRCGRRCPRCERHVAGRYRPGKCCEHCETVLHPWLLATYGEHCDEMDHANCLDWACG